jgi:hypothetical protein
MKEHILEAQHRPATEDFCLLLKDGAASLELGREALTVASPFLNVPAHEMLRPTGETRAVNYDHTLLGLWRSLRMSTLLPGPYRDLPFAQAVWYLPQGLDIWSQILCEFPGHYAREQEKCAEINLKGPRQHFEEYPPLAEGTFAERLLRLFFAIHQGDKVTAFRVFLGLANEAVDDEEKRHAIEAQVLYAGIMDLPGPRLLTGMLVNPAHKAIRARAMVDVAEAVGWEHAYAVFSIVIPDLANSPRYHDFSEHINQLLTAAFGAGYRDLRLTNAGVLTELEAEEFIDVMYFGAPEDVVNHVIALLRARAGKSPVTLVDAAVLGAARLMARIENPSVSALFGHTAHCFDYTNVVGYWLRRYNHPQAVKGAFFPAHYVNDTARYLRLRAPKDPATHFTVQPHELAPRADRLSLNQTLVELGKACDTQDAPFATALVDSYMRRTTDRTRLSRTLVFSSGKFEDDPHVPRNAMSHHEEFLHSTLPRPLRDDFFRSWTRFVSRWHKRSYEFNCFDLYERTLLQ